ncbi:TPA: hypothetical protein I7160_21815 [Vibrio vulnificus]|nr:hypothetical protein [Vibrio vulnificus]
MYTEVAIGLGGVVLGAILGHFFTVRREDRTEFNAVAEPLFEQLEKQLLLVKQKVCPHAGTLLNASDLIKFKRLLSKREKIRFNNDLEHYYRAYNKSKSQKDFIESFHSPELLEVAIQNLQEHLTRR